MSGFVVFAIMVQVMWLRMGRNLGMNKVQPVLNLTVMDVAISILVKVTGKGCNLFVVQKPSLFKIAHAGLPFFGPYTLKMVKSRSDEEDVSWTSCVSSLLLYTWHTKSSITVTYSCVTVHDAYRKSQDGWCKTTVGSVIGRAKRILYLFSKIT